MKSLLQNKKGSGQLTSLFNSIFVLILVGVLIGAGVLTLSQIKSASTEVVTGSVTNETNGFINSSGYTLAKVAVDSGFRGPVITSVINSTSGFVVASGNYTLSGNNLVNTTAVNYPTVKVSYTYTYDGSTSASNATASTITAIGGDVTFCN